MAKLNDDTHVLLDGAVKVYKRGNSKRWQATFQIDAHWVRISTGKRDLEEAKTVAREQYLDYKFRSKHDLPVVTKRFEDVAQLAIVDMQRQLDAGAGRKVFKDYIKAIDKYFIPFFGKTFITNIDHDKIQDFNAWRVTELKHVRSSAEKKAAEDIANRERCEDFATFKPLFEQVQKELNTGLRETRPFEMKAEIEKGRFFIVSGQKAYVAEKGETTITDQGRTDARLRVIFDNGTESNMLMRSLQRALNKDEAGRRITEPTAGPLFSDQTIDGDEASGTIYVLRSKADHPLVEEHRELVHKIGVTNLSVEKRIAGAHLQPTFLMANVEIVATYELYNINRTKLENLIHRIFEPGRLDIEIMDRFGRPIVPREWFLVPLFVIKEAVERIKDGTIADYRYDPQSASLILRKAD